ncbi:MAG: nucleotide exchange factor GrpE, partial [Gammaproteobacteria bacterium]|nr:nucleotide exchange factor GrpE [Gammaproteobacteria bacterium]
MNAEPDRAEEEEAASKVEDDALEDGDGADPTDTVAEDALAELQAKADENWDKYLRAAAELENVRKRAARDVENAHKFALE